MDSRHAFRASWHDYNSGVYFVTICSHGKENIFGYISKAEMHLSELGRIVSVCLNSIPVHFPNAEVWNKVIMPNHVHLVLSVGARYIAPTVATPETNVGCLKPPVHGDKCDDFHHNSQLSQVVGSFKAAVTREYNRQMRARCIAPLQDNATHATQGNATHATQDNATHATQDNATHAAQDNATHAAQDNASHATRIWQRLYHEHIIRNQRAFDNIMNYIDNNIVNWNNDCFYDK